MMLWSDDVLWCRELSDLHEEAANNRTQNFVHVRRYVCCYLLCVVTLVLLLCVDVLHKLWLVTAQHKVGVVHSYKISGLLESCMWMEVTVLPR